MSSSTIQHPATPRATLDDLMKVEGKAELIGGRIVRQMATGDKPTRIAGRIYKSLDDYAEARAHGTAYTGGIGFAVPELSSGRESFSPDASYYDGPLPSDDMEFVEGPPTFAAEVRSKNDYGKKAEDEMAAKRANYFEAGTQVVWEVDSKAGCVWKYQAGSPAQPTRFVRGDQADAEPAVPGWRMPVDRTLA